MLTWTFDNLRVVYCCSSSLSVVDVGLGTLNAVLKTHPAKKSFVRRAAAYRFVTEKLEFPNFIAFQFVTDIQPRTISLRLAAAAYIYIHYALKKGILFFAFMERKWML